MASTDATAVPETPAPAPAEQERCARCGNAFAGPDDRRAQLHNPDLCRTCHLDPRSRALPLETDIGKGWISRCVRTLLELIVSPSASFRAVDEPVAHARVLSFLATLRLSLWLVAMVWAGTAWALDDGPQGLQRATVVGEVIGAQFADTMRLWLLFLVPIGLPMLYFFGGILGHAGLALTGGARRSVGASMRAFGLALAPAFLLVGLLDVLVIAVGVPPEVWVVILGVAVLSAFVRLGVALSRTHSTALLRGLLVAIVPVVVFAGLSAGRGLLEYHRLPFMAAPPVDDYAPYPLP